MVPMSTSVDSSIVCAFPKVSQGHCGLWHNGFSPASVL